MFSDFVDPGVYECTIQLLFTLLWPCIPTVTGRSWWILFIVNSILFSWSHTPRLPCIVAFLTWNCNTVYILCYLLWVPQDQGLWLLTHFCISRFQQSTQHIVSTQLMLRECWWACLGSCREEVCRTLFWEDVNEWDFCPTWTRPKSIFLSFSVLMV